MNKQPSVEQFALMQKFKAEYPEAYWKAFAIWWDWYLLEERALAIVSGYDTDWAETNSFMCKAFEQVFRSLICVKEEAAETDEACIRCWNEGVT